MDFFNKLFSSASQYVNPAEGQEQLSTTVTKSETSRRRKTMFGNSRTKSNARLEEKQITTESKHQAVQNRESTATTASELPPLPPRAKASSKSHDKQHQAAMTNAKTSTSRDSKVSTKHANQKSRSKPTDKLVNPSMYDNKTYTNSDRLKELKKSSKSFYTATTTVRDETMDTMDSGVKAKSNWSSLRRVLRGKRNTTLISSSTTAATIPAQIPYRGSETLSKLSDAASLLDTDTSQGVEDANYDFLKGSFLDRRLICSLEDEIQIKDENSQPTEDFMNYFYLLLKSFLIQEYKNIEKRKLDPTIHSALKPVSKLIEGMLLEVNFVHTNKQSTISCQNVTDEGLMPHILETINALIPADKCLTAEQLQEENLRQMRESLVSDKDAGSTNAPAAGKSTSETNRSFYQKQRSETKCKIEVNLKKMLEIGFLNDDTKVTRLINSSLSDAKVPEKAIESAAQRKGRQAGERLWKIALGKFNHDSRTSNSA